ncbi:MAG TPA: alpha/beta fold hydrolase [Smithella sp.]|jgi:pimeloyl-ACP methyl ester carboxylesterase|nr:alpha/beta hydrolase [Smithella sp.]OQC52938.1 MAG: Alpha/beta hydrolase family protein [Deltaproteobacteria bacterium ADurb.Bin022]HNQ64532.1 alpha/beta fold hydrolase [Smithella sp.]HOE32284.1 alpha/beta fold hydrolase [Smithella sp.]HOG09248.1 alpha/beta fold hydrolase [Smithella sp.]
MKRMIPLFLLLVCMTLAGCAGVKVSFVGSGDYMSLRRGDILTTGELSTYTGASLQVVGIDKKVCDKDASGCRKALMETIGLHSENRLSALAELWLKDAMELEKQFIESGHIEATLNAYLETARYSYAYLFLTKRTPNMRALEDRQTQVRDYYNYAVEKTLTTLFEYYRKRLPPDFNFEKDTHFESGQWHITIRNEDLRLAEEHIFPEDLIPASSLSFAGLRNQYRRDGLGAELVAVTSTRVVSRQSAEMPFSETPFPPVTAVMSFPGNTWMDVLKTNEVVITGYDPYSRESFKLVGKEVPLAANFTSGYGLWLARSGFAAQSLLTLIGKGDVLEMPRVYLMQPYNPQRHIVIMLHGLASSPEAWINLANEVLGDETLRKNFQIWQVYYPTNLPIAFNHYEISKAITQTLKHFDPEGKARASQKILLIGHSMGGILSRLMVSSSGDRLWGALLKKYPLEGRRLERVRRELGPYMSFEPLPQISRAIFVAAPHKGTPVAEIALVRWIANFIKLPFSVLGRFREVAQLLVDPGSANPVSLTRSFNSIDNLSNRDPFIQLTSTLPVSSRVRYHSIIGNNTPKKPLAESSDSVVPYSSSHLEGAVSEKVIASGHSVQEMPDAIIEIRRIMHLHLKE